MAKKIAVVAANGKAGRLIVKEAVEQHWRIVGDAHRRLEVATQVGFVVDDFHRAAAQDVGRTHHQRVANLFRLLNGHFNGGDGGVRRLFQLQTVNRLLETLAVFRAVNRIRAGADNRHASGAIPPALRQSSLGHRAGAFADGRSGAWYHFPVCS